MPSDSYAGSLTRFFLRAKPLRAGAIVSGASTAVLIALLILLQSLHLSGAQSAEQSIGDHEWQLQSVADVPLGEDGSRGDHDLVEALNASGATESRVSYKAFDIPVDAHPELSLMLEENDWPSEPFPNRLELQAGAWPRTAGETVVSAALKSTFPLGSTIDLFGGELTLKVVGVVEDDFARSFPFLLTPPGTWNSLSGMSEDDARRYDARASRDLFWNSGNPDQVVQAVGEYLHPDDQEAGSALLGQLRSRSALESKATFSPIEFELATALGPFLAGLLGAWLGVRFVSRVRFTMLTIGVPLPRTALAGVGSVLSSQLLGATGGILVGVAAAMIGRLPLDVVRDSALGPVDGVLGASVALVLLTLVGSSVGMALMGRSAQTAAAGMGATASKSRIRRAVPTLRQSIPALAVLAAFSGVALSNSRGGIDTIILAGLCFGAVLVLLAPFAIGYITQRRPDSLAVALGLRRLRIERQAGDWTAIGAGILLLLSLGLTTLFFSAASTTNNQTESLVPPGQIQVHPMLESPEARIALREEVEQFVGIRDPLEVYTAEGGVVIADGATLVVRSVRDLEELLGYDLTDEQNDLLESGGTLRTKPPEMDSIVFETYSGDQHELQSAIVSGIDPSFRTFDGFILRETADNLAIPLVSQTFVYLDATSEQLELAASAPDELGFNSGWISQYSAPDVFSEPLSSTLVALAISLLATILLAGFASSSARAIRPTLAGLRAVGVSRLWLVRTLAVQIGVLLGVGLVLATIAAVVGIAIAIALSGLAIEIHVPWVSIAITFLGVSSGAALALAIATSRLKLSERMTT